MLTAVADTDFRSIEHEVLGPYAQFLRDRGRDDEAERLEERLAVLLPAADAPLVFMTTGRSWGGSSL